MGAPGWVQVRLLSTSVPKHSPVPLRGHSLEGACLGSPTWGLRVQGQVKVLSAPTGLQHGGRPVLRPFPLGGCL